MYKVRKFYLIFIAIMLLSVGLAVGCKTENDDKNVFRLEMTVSDTSGNLVENASVAGGGLSGRTGSDGVIVFSDVNVKDFSLEINAEGYIPQNKEISQDEIVSSDYNVRIEIILTPLQTQPEQPDSDAGYVPRNDNYLYFTAGFGSDRAAYYWYAEYTDNSVVVMVDAVDPDICVTAENIWDRDYIDFVIQQSSTTVGLDADKSFDVMVNPVTLDGVARYAKDSSSYGNSSFYGMISSGELNVVGKVQTEEEDGYNGYSLTIEIAYEVLGEKACLLGNLTIMPAVKNVSSTFESYWRSYVGYGCRWGKANLAVRINEDGSFCENHFDIPDFDQLIIRYGVNNGTKTIKENMASVTTDMAVRKFVNGANLFTDRTYLADPRGIPSSLKDKSYIYAPIAADYDFTVVSDGYVVVSVPSTGYDNVAKYFTDNGFVRIAKLQPRIGYDSVGGTGIYEMTDYYVKWCTVGEKYHPQKYCLVFFSSRDSYEEDYWVANSATVHLLNTDELLEKYASDSRLWQGIPGIEAVTLKNGKTRLWASWFTGSTHEPSVGNYSLYSFSDDGGKTWKFAFAVAFDDTVTNARVYDPSMFCDEDGNLWLWWNQTNYSGGDCFGGVWCVEISNPYEESTSGLPAFKVGEPKRVCDGLKMNKPTILSTGEWAFLAHSFGHQGYTTMYVSADNGETWNKRGEMYVPNALFANETAFAETVRDGKTVYMAINRTNESYNLSVSYSYDLGYTWTDGIEWDILGSSSRIVMKTLESGNLALIHHYNTANREKLCIWLSEDGGVTWPHCLILDVRSGVSYPDITQGSDGKLYVVWDYDRYGAKQILMAELSEEELLATEGVTVMDSSRIVAVSSIGVKSTISSIENNEAYLCTAYIGYDYGKRRIEWA